MAALEPRALGPLRGSHRAAAAQLGVIEPVDEVGGSHEEVQIEGPVLAVFEGAEAVEDEGLLGGGPGTQPLVEEQTVAAETLGLALDGAVGDADLSADLSVAGAADQAVEEAFEEPGVTEPVGGGEGL
jgi:hypothetical protein